MKKLITIIILAAFTLQGSGIDYQLLTINDQLSTIHTLRPMALVKNKVVDSNLKAELCVFVCKNCGMKVPELKGGYRDHCPNCLCSIHLDDKKPGDRASECHGMMMPIGLKHNSKKGWQIQYECTQCGAIKVNKSAPDDNWDEMIKLSQQPVALKTSSAGEANSLVDVRSIVDYEIKRFKLAHVKVSVKEDVPRNLELNIPEGVLNYVLGELFSNIYNHTAANAELNIYLERDNLVLKLTDNGRGIDFKELAYVFLDMAKLGMVIYTKLGNYKVAKTMKSAESMLEQGARVVTVKEATNFIHQRKEELPFVSGLSSRGSAGIGLFYIKHNVEVAEGSVKCVTGEKGTILTISIPVAKTSSAGKIDFNEFKIAITENGKRESLKTYQKAMDDREAEEILGVNSTPTKVVNWMASNLKKKIGADLGKLIKLVGKLPTETESPLSEQTKQILKVIQQKVFEIGQVNLEWAQETKSRERKENNSSKSLLVGITSYTLGHIVANLLTVSMYIPYEALHKDKITASDTQSTIENLEQIESLLNDAASLREVRLDRYSGRIFIKAFYHNPKGFTEIMKSFKEGVVKFDSTEHSAVQSLKVITEIDSAA